MSKYPMYEYVNELYEKKVSIDMIAKIFGTSETEVMIWFDEMQQIETMIISDLQ